MSLRTVFREDSKVPLAVVGQLWGVDEVEMEEAVTELESWHLVDVDWERRTLSLIDLHLDYLRASAKEDLVRWHAALLRGCGRRTLGKRSEKDAAQGAAAAKAGCAKRILQNGTGVFFAILRWWGCGVNV